MAHTNRSKSTDNPARTPAPEEMRAARESRGLSPAEAGKLCFSTGTWWEDCEAGRKRCHPAIWQYWLSRVDNPAYEIYDAVRAYLRTTRPLLQGKGLLYEEAGHKILELIDQADDRPHKP